MHNQTPVRENDTYKFLWDFNIKTDPLISARRLDLIIIIKKERRKKEKKKETKNKEKENLQNCGI